MTTIAGKTPSSPAARAASADSSPAQDGGAGASVCIWDIDERGWPLRRRSGAAAGADAHGRLRRWPTGPPVGGRGRGPSAAGPVDILVNNAGVVSGKHLLDLTPDEQIERTFRVNTLSLFWVTTAFLPRMIAAAPVTS